MKLLLTSNGLSNNSIAKALRELVGKTLQETTIVFIPTASNVEKGDKNWLINDLVNLQKQNFKSIEIADISLTPQEIWKESFKNADVLFFEGGNNYHLMRWLNQTGLTQSLSGLLKDKVYVGVSAGSMVTGPDLNLQISQLIYEEDFIETEELQGMNFVDFYFFPHLNSKWFTSVRKENIKKFSQTTNRAIYALDDSSALKIIDGKIEVVSEGEWFLIKQK